MVCDNTSSSVWTNMNIQVVTTPLRSKTNTTDEELKIITEGDSVTNGTDSCTCTQPTTVNEVFEVPAGWDPVLYQELIRAELQQAIWNDPAAAFPNAACVLDNSATFSKSNPMGKQCLRMEPGPEATCLNWELCDNSNDPDWIVTATERAVRDCRAQAGIPANIITPYKVDILNGSSIRYVNRTSETGFLTTCSCAHPINVFVTYPSLPTLDTAVQTFDTCLTKRLGSVPDAPGFQSVACAGPGTECYNDVIF